MTVEVEQHDHQVAQAAEQVSPFLPELFTPIFLGELHAKNRIILAPLTRARCEGRVMREHNIEYYRQRASAGLLICEPAAIAPGAVGNNDTPGMWTQEHLEGWTKLCEELHKIVDQGGSRPTLVCQLWHSGRMSHSTFLEHQRPKAPSAIAITGGNGVQGADLMEYDHETPQELTVAEIEQIVSDFARAAQMAQQAGFDGIELHGATGYLLDTFFQSCSNERPATDRYTGTSFRGRFQLLREILERVTKIFPGRVGVKISPNACFNGMGLGGDNFEFFTWMAKELDGFDLAYLHVMDGISADAAKVKWWGKMNSTGCHRSGRCVSLADLRPLTRHRLIGNANYTANAAAERIFHDRTADAVSFGRVFFSNPDFAEKVRNGGKLNPLPEPDAWFKPSEKTRRDVAWGYTEFGASKEMSAAREEDGVSTRCGSLMGEDVPEAAPVPVSP